MLSIYEIAEKTNFSPATVSRALNPELRHKVKQKTLDKILKFCEENNYYGKLAARSLASGKTFCIGLVLGSITMDFASPFFSLQMDGIIQVLARHGYTLKIIPIPEGGRNEVDKSVRKALLGNEVDGFILNAAMIGKETLDELKQMKFPVVILTAAHAEIIPSGIPTVGIDNMPGFRALCRHLREQGHKKLAILGNDGNDPRLHTLKKIAPEFGLAVREFTFRENSPRIAQQMFEMYRQVRNNWAELKQYTAWHCITDLWAIGAKRALEEIDPESSIFISGYDNMEENPNYTTDKPEISTIAPPYRKLGMQAAEILFDYENHETLHLVGTRFLLRNHNHHGENQ